MLGKFIKVNSLQIPNPNPGTWKQNMNPDESEFFTESGRRKTIPRRLERVSWSAEFNCTSVMLETLKNFCRLPRVTVEINGVSYQGTLRAGEESLVEDSENVPGTDGLWILPLVFQSF